MPAGLALNIDEVDNSLDFDLVMSVSQHFQLRLPQAEKTRDEVLAVVAIGDSLDGAGATHDCRYCDVIRADPVGRIVYWLLSPDREV